MARHGRWKSILAAGAAVAGLGVLVAVGFGVRAQERADEAAEVLSGLESQPRRLPRPWVRTTRARPADSRAERIAAGARLEAEVGVLIPTTPTTPTTTSEGEGDPVIARIVRLQVAGPESPLAIAWRDVLANATDERLPDPPAELVAWLDDHEADTMRLARLVLESPTPAWEREPAEWEPASREADFLAGTLTVGAGVDAWRGRHAAAAEKLDAAWVLRLALAEASPTPHLPQVFLGALRCTRVPDAGEWIERLQAIDVRALFTHHRIWRAKRGLETTTAAAEAELPAELPAPARAVAVGLVTMPADWEAAVRVEHAAAAVHAVESLAPCDDPARGVTPSWRREDALSDVLPARSSLMASRALVMLEQDEAAQALTIHVLAIRAGREVADPCDRVAIERGPDGRTTARCTAAPHPLAAELGLWGARSFTLSPGEEPAGAGAIAALPG